MPTLEVLIDASFKLNEAELMTKLGDPVPKVGFGHSAPEYVAYRRALVQRTVKAIQAIINDVLLDRTLTLELVDNTIKTISLTDTPSTSGVKPVVVAITETPVVTKPTPKPKPPAKPKAAKTKKTTAAKKATTAKAKTR